MAAQGSVSTEADGKYPCSCCSVIGKCTWQMPTCSWQGPNWTRWKKIAPRQNWGPDHMTQKQSWAALEYWDLICWSPEYHGDTHPSFALAQFPTFRRVSNKNYRVVVLNHQVAQSKGTGSLHDPEPRPSYVWKQRRRTSAIFLWKCWQKSLLLRSGSKSKVSLDIISSVFQYKIIWGFGHDMD